MKWPRTFIFLALSFISTALAQQNEHGPEDSSLLFQRRTILGTSETVLEFSLDNFPTAGEFRMAEFRMGGLAYILSSHYETPIFNLDLRASGLSLSDRSRQK